jgi:hypothetical protein
VSAEQELQVDAHRLPQRPPLINPRALPLAAPGVVKTEVVFSDTETGSVSSAGPLRRPVSGTRRILFSLAALGISVITTCAVVELGLRCCGYGRNYTNPMGSFFEPDSELGCHGKPNFVGRFRRVDFDVLVEHDENGCRRTEAPIAAARHDIYVLGDSFVWGYGVGQGDLFTNQIQRQLADQQVHNLGLIGAGTVQEYLMFRKYVAAKLKPGDTVVLVFFGNDFGDNIGQHEKGRIYAKIDGGQVCLVPPEPPTTFRQLKNGLKDASYLFNLVSYCADRIKDIRATKMFGVRETRPLPSPAQIKADSSDDGPAVRITRHYVSELRNACRAKGVRFLAVNVPGQAELGEDDVTSTSDLCLGEEIAYRQAFERMVHDLGIETGDLMGPMLAAKRSGRFDRLTFPHDFHWNAAGHTLAAEVIAAALH